MRQPSLVFFFFFFQLTRRARGGSRLLLCSPPEFVARLFAEPTVSRSPSAFLVAPTPPLCEPKRCLAIAPTGGRHSRPGCGVRAGAVPPPGGSPAAHIRAAQASGADTRAPHHCRGRRRHRHCHRLHSPDREHQRGSGAGGRPARVTDRLTLSGGPAREKYEKGEVPPAAAVGRECAEWWQFGPLDTDR